MKAYVNNKVRLYHLDVTLAHRSQLVVVVYISRYVEQKERKDER